MPDLSTFNGTLHALTVSLQTNLPIMGRLVGLMFAIQIVNAAMGYRLCAFGIHPRRLIGLAGIPLCPWIHGSFNHFISNALVFFALGNLIAIEGQQQFLLVSGMIMALGGFATWLVGRSAVHVGASGVIMGYWGYLLVNAYHHPTLITIVMGIVCFYFFGGLMSSMIPDDVKALAPSVLRHRTLLSPAAEIEGRQVDTIISGLVERTEAPR